MSPFQRPGRSRLHRQIAALADGSYEEPGLRQQIASSPELTALLEQQGHAVALTRAARPAAPPHLRDALAAPSRRSRASGAAPSNAAFGPGPGAAVRPARAASAPGRPRRPALGMAVATAGVVALAVIALLPGGHGPALAQVAALADRGPVGAPPGLDPTHRGALRSQLDGVRYPYWQAAFGWRGSGTRTDRLDGRATMTVFYARAGARLAYTIVGGRPLAQPRGGTLEHADGTSFRGLPVGSRAVVTWRRGGRTCVLSAVGVPLPTLLRLAEWRYDANPA